MKILEILEVRGCGTLFLLAVAAVGLAALAIAMAKAGGLP